MSVNLIVTFLYVRIFLGDAQSDQQELHLIYFHQDQCTLLAFELSLTKLQDRSHRGTIGGPH